MTRVAKLLAVTAIPALLIATSGPLLAGGGGGGGGAAAPEGELEEVAGQEPVLVPVWVADMAAAWARDMAA
ncbi:hypothetical protein QA640_03140 [Bradyrhizobium sp. CB82]|uniref:hypothetical protein n=1 Tax=Bradyrhizobium sp. CB82 TaxID=3039159 RepID=UPI0024B0823C|nr:hypothetical protein [Bradyrhizobium sp. CB82]WFU41540.1 hypothetical protein QA640_03140 [Bradyrhizobium sp. CB82]